MTRNQELNVLHVKNSTDFAKGIEARIVSGDTLIFDFIYFLHPVTAPDNRLVFLCNRGNPSQAVH